MVTIIVRYNFHVVLALTPVFDGIDGKKTRIFFDTRCVVLRLQYGIVGEKYFQQSIVFRIPARICLDFKRVILLVNVVLSYVCTRIAYWDVFEVLVFRPSTNFYRSNAAKGR